MRTGWYVFAAAAVLWGGVSATAEACSLTVAWEEYKPFQFRDGNQVRGVDADLIREAAELAGCGVRFREMPWVRQLKMLELGNINVMIGAFITPEREKFAVFSRPSRRQAMHLAFPPGAEERDLDSVIDEGRGRVGVVKGYVYGGVVSDAMTDTPTAFETSMGDAANLKKLAAKRLAAAVIDPLRAVALMRDLGAEVTVAREETYGANVHFMLSKKSGADYLDRLNAGLKEIQEGGGYDAILDRYGLSGR